MRIPLLIARITSAADTTWHLALHIVLNILSEARHLRSRHQATTAPVLLLRELVNACRYHLRAAFDPRTFFALDGDGHGRRRADLDRAERRQRRALAILRRRHATMLLRALGDTADEVEATLTRHWQHTTRDGWSFDLIPDYLTTCLCWREGSTHHQIDVHRWASNVGGVWVATPAPVRRYLDRADEHETRLYDSYCSGNAGPGVRPVPERT